MSRPVRHQPPRPILVLALLVAGILAGCAAPKASFVLLPEAGAGPGLVEVTNEKGTTLLSRPLQEVDVTRHQPPGPAQQLDQAALQKRYGAQLGNLPAAPVHELLYFQFGSTSLTPDSERRLGEIARTVQARRPAQVSVIGHADTVGTLEYNYRLGLERATAVAERLRALGADAVSTEIISRGESEPLVKTADETLEPRNRRAEVTVR